MVQPSEATKGKGTPPEMGLAQVLTQLMGNTHNTGRENRPQILYILEESTAACREKTQGARTALPPVLCFMGFFMGYRNLGFRV